VIKFIKKLFEVAPKDDRALKLIEEAFERKLEENLGCWAMEPGQYKFIVKDAGTLAEADNLIGGCYIDLNELDKRSEKLHRELKDIRNKQKFLEAYAGFLSERKVQLSSG